MVSDNIDSLTCKVVFDRIVGGARSVRVRDLFSDHSNKISSGLYYDLDVLRY